MNPSEVAALGWNLSALLARPGSSRLRYGTPEYHRVVDRLLGPFLPLLVGVLLAGGPSRV